MAWDRDYVFSGLKQKGFRIEKFGKDICCRLYIDEYPTGVKSRVGGHSKGKYKTLGDDIITEMVRSLFFQTKSQMKKYLDCPYKYVDYVKDLKNNGHLRRSK